MSILWEPDNLAEFKEVQLPLYPEYKQWADTGIYQDTEGVPCPILPCGNNAYLLPAGTPISVSLGLITDVEDEADPWDLAGFPNAVVAEDYYFYLNQAAARQSVKLLIHGYVDQSRISEAYLALVDFYKETIDNEVKAALAENQIFLVAPGGMASGGGSGGGSGTGPLVVTLSGDKKTADKTFEEIGDALASGRGAVAISPSDADWTNNPQYQPFVYAAFSNKGVVVSYVTFSTSGTSELHTSVNSNAGASGYPEFEEGES